LQEELTWYKVIRVNIDRTILFILFIVIFSAQNIKASDAVTTTKYIRIGRANLHNRIEVETLKNDKSIEPETIKEEKIESITSGKGTWVNLWNYPKNNQAFLDRLKKFNIDTIYLQVNRSNTPTFKLKKEIDKLLKDAHANNIKVIGWSYCFLKNPSEDADKFIQVANYISPDGERFDGMAADIEENTALWAVTSYTEKIKKNVANDYPLIAIVYSPKIKVDYPWEYVANNWDVLMPMTYWHGIKNRNNDTVYNFVKDSINDLKRLSKKDNLNIHLITDGDRTNHGEVEASLKAAKDHGVNAGISIYPEHLSSDEMLRRLGVF
jgi:hypothetical protein